MKRIRNDFFLVVIILGIVGALYLILNNNSQSSDLVAEVYYDNDLVLSIDLEALGDTPVCYSVTGEIGVMILEAKHNAIRVKEDCCPNHCCSNQGFVSNTISPIVCLPNKVFIKIVGGNTQVDVIV